MEKPFVLIADDNEATCTLLTALLRADFAVDVANDGGEAIEKLKSRQYAAILLDLLMPVDGYAVLAYLKEQRPDLLRRVLVVTASLSSRQLQRVKEYDVYGVMAKPFEVDALQAAVHEMAGDDGSTPPIGGPLLASGMILLLGELLKRV